MRRTMLCVLLILFMMPAEAVAQGLPQPPSLLPAVVAASGWKHVVQLALTRAELGLVRQEIEVLKAQPALRDPKLTVHLKVLEADVVALEVEIRRLQARPSGSDR
jgi:hypothetical protein